MSPSKTSLRHLFSVQCFIDLLFWLARLKRVALLGWLETALQFEQLDESFIDQPFSGADFRDRGITRPIASAGGRTKIRKIAWPIVGAVTAVAEQKTVLHVGSVSEVDLEVVERFAR